MSKDCAQCGGVVFPLEQFKCSDQIWHRNCFKCSICKKTLTLQNYRGFEKKAYCTAHCPQPKQCGAGSDFLEFRRAAANTKLNSATMYQADFQRVKGTKTAYAQPIPMKTQSPNIVQNHSIRNATDSNQHTSNERKSSGDSGHFEATRGSWTVEMSLVPQTMQQARPRLGVTALSSRHDTYSNGTYPAYSSETNGHSNGSVGNGIHPTTSRAVAPTPTLDMHFESSDKSSAPRNNAAETNGKWNASLGSSMKNDEYQAAQPQSFSGGPVAGQGHNYRAVYEYQAQDDDEVTFVEGDIILHGEPIDEGWMYGTIQRTGKYGMLPSNYVQPLN